MTRRGAADLLAGVVALVVFVAGLVTLVADSDILAPESRTTVTKEAVAEKARTTKTTKTTTRPARPRKPGERAETTKTVETTGPVPAQPAETTTTVEAGDRTFSERVLGDGGIVVLQIAALLLAAVIAGAVVQRVILGQFGFKFGSFELADVADVADESADGIANVKAKIDAVLAALETVDAARRDDTADLKDDLALAYKRMALIEDRIGD